MTALSPLPPEIHRCIVPYLTDADLCEYRCACKQFAAIGAKELFKVIPFHASSASVQRLQELAKHEGLSKIVQSLVWDSNLWDVEVARDDTYDEFEIYINRYRTMQMNYKDAYPDGLPKDIEQTMHDTEAHGRVHEERWQDERKTLGGSLHQNNIAGLLQNFPALRKIHIINGAFEIRDRAVQKIDPNIQRNTLDFIPRGDRLLALDLEEGPLGVHALVRGVEGLSALGRPWQLEIDALAYMFFKYGIYNDALEARVSKLTRLTLALSYWREDRIGPEDVCELFVHCRAVLKDGGLFKRFLRSMTALCSLSISLHRRNPLVRLDAVASIRDLIPLEEDWTDLQELSLTSIDSAEEDFIRLVQNHSSTLKKLYLKDMCLVPDSSWIHVLESVQPILKLDSATFAGDLYSCSEEREGALNWWLDGGLGEDLSDYMISGGDCPLTEDNSMIYGVEV